MTHPRLEEPCKHYLGTPAECPLCTEEEYVHPSPMVWITAGGEAWHLDPECWLLRMGQDNVADQGGNPAPLEQVPLRTAQLDRAPCNGCAPKNLR